MSKYRYNILFKVKTLLTVMIYLFLIILSCIKVLYMFSIWYVLLGIFSGFLLLFWMSFIGNRTSLYLDEEGYDFLPRKGLNKIGKKVFWKNIIKVRSHPFFPGVLWLYDRSEVLTVKKRKKIIRRRLVINDYQEKKKLLQEIVSYCKHAEIDPRIIRKV